MHGGVTGKYWEHGVQRVGTKCNGGIASSVHGLLKCILGNGQLITKLLIKPFVNGLRLVEY